MRSKELKTYNLPTDSYFVTEINAKPTILFLVLILLGVASLFLSFSRIYGVTLICVGLTGICFMPRVVLMEFYNDYLVLYNKADKNTCEIIYYDEVDSWHYSWSTTRDYLVIKLLDGSEERIEAFSKTIFEVAMLRFLKDKHIRVK